MVSFARSLILLLLIAWPVLGGAQPQPPAPVISDDDIEDRMLDFGEELIKRKDTVRMKTLIGQLDRKQCSLKLPPPGATRLSPEALIRVVRPGVLVVGSLFQCTRCKDWHLSTATGFALTESGAIATCYHVVNQPTHTVMVVMTDDGRLFGVREVLAADRAHDVAILQVDGTGFVPLPIAPRAPVGSAAYVVSHPSSEFYTFTAGMVSRYFVSEDHDTRSTMMSITAEYGPGSSGCPVFNDCGAVVGMAESIVSSGYRNDKGQMKHGPIFKHARPADAVLRLVR